MTDIAERLLDLHANWSMSGSGPAILVEAADEIRRLNAENGCLRHSSLVARLSHEQLNRFIRLFDGAGFKGHQVDIQAKMAVDEIDRLRLALATAHADGMEEGMDAMEVELEKVISYPSSSASRRTKDGYPSEICYDEFAYKRMVDSYRAGIIAAIRKAKENAR